MKLKHHLLEEVWRVRDAISSECGHEVSRLRALVRREETKAARRAKGTPPKRRAAKAAV